MIIFYSSVEHTKRATEEELFQSLKQRLLRMVHNGNGKYF